MKLEQHFNERNRRDLGIVWLIIGVIILFSGLSGGLVFFALGFIWLASSQGQGLEWARHNPGQMKLALQVATIGLIALALILLVKNFIH